MKIVATILMLTLSSCSFSLFKMPKPITTPDSTTVIKTDSIKGEDLSKPIDLLSDKISKAIDEQQEEYNDSSSSSRVFHWGRELNKDNTIADNDSGRVFSTYGNSETDYYKAKWTKSVDALKEIAAEFNAFKASYKPCASTTTTVTTKVKERSSEGEGGQSWGAILISFVAVIALVIDKLKKKSNV